jgi:hypothetical protein
MVWLLTLTIGRFREKWLVCGGSSRGVASIQATRGGKSCQRRSLVELPHGMQRPSELGVDRLSLFTFHLSQTPRAQTTLPSSNRSQRTRLLNQTLPFREKSGQVIGDLLQFQTLFGGGVARFLERSH